MWRMPMSHCLISRVRRSTNSSTMTEVVLREASQPYTESSQ